MVARKELECRAAWHRMSPPRSVSHHGRAGSIRCTGPLRSIRSKCRSMKADSIASFRCDTDLVRHISTGLDGLRHVMEEAASGVSQLPWKHMKQETICMTSRGIQYQDHLIDREIVGRHLGVWCKYVQLFACMCLCFMPLVD